MKRNTAGTSFDRGGCRGATWLLALLIYCLAAPVSAQSLDSESMDRGAPQQCLAYFSWTGWKDFQPDRSLTEKWLAQPEMRQSFDKVKDELLGLAQQELPPVDYRRLEFGTELALKLIESPALICVHDVEPSQSQLKLVFSLVARWGDDSQDMVQKIRQFLKVQAEWEPTDCQIGGSPYLEYQTATDVPSIYLGAEDGHLVFAVDRTAVEAWQRDRLTDPPQWLSDVTTRFASSHITGVIRVDIDAVLQRFQGWIDADAQQWLDYLRVDQWQELQVTFGLEPEGSVMRGGLIVQQPMEGVLGWLSPDQPVTALDMAGVKPGSDQVHVFQLPVHKLLPYVEQVCQQFQLPNPTDEPLQQLEADTGIQLQQVLQTLSGQIVAYGSLTVPYVQRGWTFRMGVRDADGLAAGLDQLLESLSEKGRLTFEKSTDGDRTVYQVEASQVAYFHLSEDQLVVSLNRRSIQQYWKRYDKAVADPAIAGEYLQQLDPFQRFLTDPVFHERKFLSASTIDFRPYLQLAVPAISLVMTEAVPGTDLSIRDLPPLPILLNHLEPSLYAVFQGPDGYEFYYRQTAPLLSPGISTPVLAGLLLPAVQAARAAARRASSQNHVRQFSLAMQHFAAVHGALPARYSVDSQGKPLLSWRVHLLPYMEQEDLYNEFHLDEPWDSPHNRKLVERMPAIFMNPSLPLQSGRTSYQMFVANSLGLAAATGKDPVKVPLSECSAETALQSDSDVPLLMVCPAEVPWTAPQDAQTLNSLFLEGTNARMLGTLTVLLPNGRIVEMPFADVRNLDWSLPEDSEQ